MMHQSTGVEILINGRKQWVYYWSTVVEIVLLDRDRNSFHSTTTMSTVVEIHNEAKEIEV